MFVFLALAMLSLICFRSWRGCSCCRSWFCCSCYCCCCNVVVVVHVWFRRSRRCWCYSVVVPLSVWLLLCLFFDVLILLVLCHIVGVCCAVVVEYIGVGWCIVVAYLSLYSLFVGLLLSCCRFNVVVVLLYVVVVLQCCWCVVLIACLSSVLWLLPLCTCFVVDIAVVDFVD